MFLILRVTLIGLGLIGVLSPFWYTYTREWWRLIVMGVLLIIGGYLIRKKTPGE